MIVIEQIEELRNSIHNLKKDRANSSVGFVPTMGALHAGHQALMQEAKAQSDIVVVSVFVNPTQFNDPKDLEKYPRNIEADKELLRETGVDILFFPSETTIYPNGEPAYEIDFNGLDKMMEGKFRKNHFKNVAMVVERLFEIVQPDTAFFGLKDFQQLAIIRHMVQIRQLPVNIVSVAIERSESGLALSSRNALLSDEMKTEALIIYKTLSKGKEWADEGHSPEQVLKKMKKYFESGNLTLEYVEIVDNTTLLPARTFLKPTTCCIAAYAGPVRLIDNMQFS